MNRKSWRVLTAPAPASFRRADACLVFVAAAVALCAAASQVAAVIVSGVRF